VDLVVGDLDSASRGAVDAAVADGALVERHPAEKDATDLDLALAACLARSATLVTVVGGHGGRLDHLAANLMLLASPRYEALELDAWMGEARITVVRDRREIEGVPGSLCTLLATNGPASGVTTEGLRYPLRDAELTPGSTLGVSNVLDEPVAAVSLGGGVVLAIQPTALVDMGGSV
jgi:thiamine pyrophosphokinase